MACMRFPSYTPEQLFRMALLFFAFLLAAQVFSYLYAFVPTSPALIWPASGIALAGLILGGLRLWPAVFLAAFVHQLLNGNGLAIAVGLAIANALQPILGAWLLRRFGFRNAFSRVPDTIVFFLIAFITTAIVPTLGLLTFAVADRPVPNGIMGTFLPWWIAQMFSVLVITPLLVRWLPKLSVDRTRAELMEACLALLSVIAVAVLLFWTPFRDIGGVPLVYLILVPLLWIGLRVGPRFMTLALFLNAGIALGGTAYRLTAAGNIAGLGNALLQTEIFIIMISFIFLLLVTVAEERKDTAKDLRENVRQLEDAVERVRREDEAKSRFIATLAHELRNPLAPLMSSVELLKLGKPSAQELERLAEGMTDNLKTMRHLLDDLLDISRISREKLVLATEQVDLLAALHKSLWSVSALARERTLSLEASLPEHAVLLEADPVRLEQIFVNLLHNAVKYTEPGGQIRLAARTEAGMALVTVEDTGIGMDADVLAHVFEPFFQMDQPGKLRAGLGIGLSLTKNLVELHGGSVEAASKGAGSGSVFTVRLPLATAASKEQRPATPARELAEGALRILVVDDNRAAADALTKLLTLRGNELHTMYTGTDALEAAPRIDPDVVLLDIGLPDVDGYAVARGLVADARVSATLVALTGFGQESDIQKAEKAGFAFHLTKPAGLAEIEEVLSQIARR